MRFLLRGEGLMSEALKKMAGVFAVVLMTACTPGGDDDSVAQGVWSGVLERLPPEFVLGKPAPDFALPVVMDRPGGLSQGDSLSTTDYLGDVVVLDFWHTSCIPCQAEHYTLSEVSDRYRGRGVRFIGITRDYEASLRRWVQEHGEFAYPILQDDGDVHRLYRVNGWPTKVVLDREGRVAWWRPGGPIEDSVLSGVIEDVLSDRRPSAATTASYPVDILPTDSTSS